MAPNQLMPFVEARNRIVRSALARYPIKVERTTFLQHNSGITFFIESHHPSASFLLKIHVAVGTGEIPRLEHLRAHLLWLDDLHTATGMIVQIPTRNQSGDIVTQVPDERQGLPHLCTLQQWVEGEPPHGHLTSKQAFGIGQMMARLHRHSSLWTTPDNAFAVMPDVEDARGTTASQVFQQSVGAGLLSARELELILKADQLIVAAMRKMPRDPQTWGPIHGDLSHSNLLLHEGEVRPIDFDSMCVAPYHYDLGVTMYHILYQEPAIRAALLAGYQTVGTLPAQHPLWLEESVTWAAMNNLTFQVTIPEQRASPLLARNLRQLASDFCAKLVDRQTFVLG